MGIAVAEGALLAIASLPRKHPVIPAKGVIGGIAQVDTGEIGLRAEFAIRQKNFPGVEAAMVRIERHVAGVTNISYPRPPHSHRLRQQRNLRQADLQGGRIDDNTAVGKGVDQGGGLGQALGEAQGAGKNRGLISGDHSAVVVAAGKSQVERWLIE